MSDLVCPKCNTWYGVGKVGDVCGDQSQGQPVPCDGRLVRMPPGMEVREPAIIVQFQATNRELFVLDISGKLWRSIYVRGLGESGVWERVEGPPQT